MDAYQLLGVPRGCTREQLKERFRSLVHRAHPDRGGEGDAFVRLCTAYHEVLDELDRAGDRENNGGTARVRGAADPPERGAAREDYLTWVRQFSEGSLRKPPTPWWRKNPGLAKACLLGLIGLGGVIVLCAAVALGLRWPSSPSGRSAGARRGRSEWRRDRPADRVPTADRASPASS